MDILVVGNALGNIESCLSKTVICFNGFDEDRIHGYAKLIRIESGHTYGKANDFVVSDVFGASDYFAGLYDAMLASAGCLETRLNCWPSSGLACLYALQQMQLPFSACKFSFSPSMLRKGLAVSKANASSYHNWLGELRIALQHFPNCLNDIVLDNTVYGCVANDDPFGRLLSSALNIDVFAELANVNLATWLTYASVKKLIAIEHLFYLERGSKYSNQWWFFDDKGAGYMDAIFQNIVICQYHCYCAY